MLRQLLARPGDPHLNGLGGEAQDFRDLGVTALLDGRQQQRLLEFRRQGGDSRMQALRLFCDVILLFCARRIVNDGQGLGGLEIGGAREQPADTAATAPVPAFVDGAL